MFLDNISQNIDILVVMNVWKNNFGFHSNQKTQGQKHQVNNLYFINQVCQIILRHLNTFLQFRLLFHEPHCTSISPAKLQASNSFYVPDNCLPDLKFTFQASNLLFCPQPAVKHRPAVVSLGTGNKNCMRSNPA